MSLIGEALKKAHLEAVRQDGSSARLAHTPGVAQYRQPHPAGRRSWMTALIASNILLALLVAAAVIWKTNGSEETATSAPTPAKPSVAAAVVPNPVTKAPESSVTAPPPQEAETPAVERAAVATAQKPVQEQPAAAEPARKTAPPQQAPVTVAEAPAPRPKAATTVDGLIAGQTYMRSIPAPGGTELVLSGMSVAGGKGVALINSRMVREGDRVGPFLVGPIADRRVALDYKGITVYLKLP